ncbi:MAG: nucleotide exchange factor GrpE [Eubacteriales bacterium]|nr:nucleotide exchange factor GrpE [Eubacteriales bacterium]
MIPINDKENEILEETQAEDTVSEETSQEEPIEVIEEDEVPIQEEAEEEKPSKKDRRQKREEKKAAKESEKLAAKDEELAILNDKYLRVCAEYDNFRKRSQKEKDSLYGDIRASVITSFLPVYDNLVRALDTKTEDEAYAKGVEMIMNQFNTTLEKLGVEEIPALGEKFDPTIHNAVMHVDDDSKGENEIVEVFQKGFKIGDKIIRFAMVKVAN